MPDSEREHATDQATTRKLVTECCLIAADVDKTLLEQNESEELAFQRHVAPRILEAAETGMKLAFVTGNSMGQITGRFLRWLLGHMCFNGALELLPQLHFFCSSGGVYFHFSKEDKSLAALLATARVPHDELSEAVLDALTEVGSDKERSIRPRFVDAAYLARTHISEHDARELERILTCCGEAYFRRLSQKRKILAKSYDLKVFDKAGGPVQPLVEVRRASFCDGSVERQAIVQLTLKPVLSFRQGLTSKITDALFEKDLRTETIAAIEQQLDACGLGHYEARAGGRASIDVTLGKLDKAYALEFLIDRLHLRGNPRRGQRLGANAIYFGDEVIVGGGNDYPVTRIPGLLIFAVNKDTKRIPFQSNVLVPSSDLRGPEATAEVLGDLIKLAKNGLNGRAQGAEGHPANAAGHISSIDALRIKLFRDRIEAKIHDLHAIGRLSPDEWLSLHAIVTLIARNDPSARRWITLLVDNLDGTMAHLHSHPHFLPNCLGG